MVETETEQTPAVKGPPNRRPIPDDEHSVDLVEMVRTLQRGAVRILAITGTGLVLSLFVSCVLPTRYTSTASFIPPNITSGAAAATALAGQLAPLGGSDLLGLGKNSSDLYAGILKSRSIARYLVARFNLTQVYGVKKESQAEERVQGATTIIPDAKSSIVALSFSAGNPRLAHDVAIGYMDALRETNGRLALSQASQRRAFFEEQLTTEKDNLANAEVELKKTQESSGLIAPAGQTEVEIRTIAEIQAQIAARQVELAALRQSATDQNPQVIRIRSEIEDLQLQLQRMQKGTTQQSSISIPTSRVPQVQLEYVRKLRDVKYHETLFEMLAKQYEAARLDEAREAPVVQILDEPSYPDTRSFPKRSYFAAAGLITGLLAGCGWVLFQDRSAV